MVKITNGEKTLTVTQGAYNSVYAPNGWQKIEPAAEPTEMSSNTQTDSGVKLSEPEDKNTTEDNFVQENDDSEINSEELSKIPLTDMNSSQLKAYANKLGVDIKGVKSRKVVIERIRAVL